MQTNQLSLRPTSEPSPQSNSAKPQEDKIQQLLCRSGVRADTVTSEKNQCGFLLFMVVRKIKDNVYIQPTF